MTVDAPDPGFVHNASTILFGDLGMTGSTTAPLRSFTTAVGVVAIRAAETLHLAFLKLVGFRVGGKEITDERNPIRRFLSVA
jgi:hypothetical protein